VDQFLLDRGIISLHCTQVLFYVSAALVSEA
jgi:hypothetical protein